MITSRILPALFCLLLPFMAHAQAILIGTTGTWTPAVTASSTAGTPAYTTAVGSYIKFGHFSPGRYTANGGKLLVRNLSMISFIYGNG